MEAFRDEEDCSFQSCYQNPCTPNNIGSFMEGRTFDRAANNVRIILVIPKERVCEFSGILFLIE